MNRKRKASEELSRSTSFVASSPPDSHTTMYALRNWLSGACHGFVEWYLGAPLTTMPTGNEAGQNGQSEAYSESRVGPLNPRSNDAMSTSREQRRHPKARRSKLTINSEEQDKEFEKSAIDLTGLTEEEASHLLDGYWEPPPLPCRAKPANTTKTERVVIELSDDDEDPQDRLQRHNSEPSVTPSTQKTTPEPSTQSLSRDGSTWRESQNRVNGSSRYKREPKRDVSPTKKDRELNENLDDMLLKIEDLKGLQISTTKRDKREQERIERERQARAKALQARKERRLNRRHPQKPLVQPLNSKWESEVDCVQSCRDPHQVITKSLEGTELRLKDFGTLLGNRAWLNDEIINTYIEWIVVAANEAAKNEAESYGETPSLVPRFIAHNSFFYENLKKKGPSSTDRLMKRKKAPGVSLMDVDTLFVPICSGSHWTIGAVRPVAKTIEYFDSMGGRKSEFFTLIRAWLKHQLGSQYVESEWTQPNTGCAVQNNGYDCGVFVCTNAFCVAFGLDTSCYIERDMFLQRRSIAAVLVNRGFNGDFSWDKSGLLE